MRNFHLERECRMRKGGLHEKRRVEWTTPTSRGGWHTQWSERGIFDDCRHSERALYLIPLTLCASEAMMVETNPREVGMYETLTLAEIEE